MIRSRDPEWLQKAIIFLIGIFRRVGLIANIAKSNNMTCHLGVICVEFVRVSQERGPIIGSAFGGASHL